MVHFLLSWFPSIVLLGLMDSVWRLSYQYYIEPHVSAYLPSITVHRNGKTLEQPIHNPQAKHLSGYLLGGTNIWAILLVEIHMF